MKIKPLQAYQINSPEMADRAGKEQAAMLFQGYLNGKHAPPKKAPVTNWFSKGALSLSYPLYKKAVAAAELEWEILHKAWRKARYWYNVMRWGPWVISGVDLFLIFYLLLRSL